MRVLWCAVILLSVLGMTANTRYFSTTAVQLYVAADGQGDDTNSGSPGSPMATITKAVSTLQSLYDTPSPQVILMHGAHTGEHFTCLGHAGPGASEIGIIGDKDHPEQVLIWNGNISGRDGCILGISGVQMASDVACDQLVLAGPQMGTTDVDHVIVGPCPGGSIFQTNDGGFINLISDVTVYPGSNTASVYALNHGGTITTSGATITLPNYGAVSNAFVYDVGGHFLGANTNYAGLGSGGGTSGRQWLLLGCGTMTGASSIPGTSPGRVVDCGQSY